jgi:hypothetical protein
MRINPIEKSGIAKNEIAKHKTIKCQLIVTDPVGKSVNRYCQNCDTITIAAGKLF